MAHEIVPSATMVIPKENSANAKSSVLRGGGIILSVLGAAFPVLIGIGCFLMVWSIVSAATPLLPGPWDTSLAAWELFKDPFYTKTVNDVGIGWQILKSLQRVLFGFGLAAVVGIPAGFAIGRFTFLSRVAMPVISLLKPVSPLAWLPIGLAVFKAANPSAIFVIFITSIWPMIINTAFGVRSISDDYLNLARVLSLSEWKVFTKILLPSSLPYVVTGVRLSIGVAWLVIVAAEMLTGGIGIGFWMWDEWNNLNMAHILVGILIIGIVGLALELLLTAVTQRFDYAQR